MVEIGSYQGESTEIFCNNSSIAKVYSVDPYLNGYDPDDAASTTPMNIVEESFNKRMAVFIESGKCIKLKMKSEDALNYINEPNNFVYIDGCHTYEAVKYDLENWIKKIQNGGYIGGHDYKFKGVRRAIDEFISENNLKIEQLYCDTSWLIRA